MSAFDRTEDVGCHLSLGVGCLDVSFSAYLQGVKESLNNLSADGVVDSLEASSASQEFIQPNVVKSATSHAVAGDAAGEYSL